MFSKATVACQSSYDIEFNAMGENCHRVIMDLVAGLVAAGEEERICDMELHCWPGSPTRRTYWSARTLPKVREAFGAQEG